MYQGVLATQNTQKRFLQKVLKLYHKLKQHTLIYCLPSVHINGACCVKTGNKAKNIAFQAMSARQIPIE